MRRGLLACCAPTQAQLELLSELRRVVRPPGRIGLLVLVAQKLSPGRRARRQFLSDC